MSLEVIIVSSTVPIRKIVHPETDLFRAMAGTANSDGTRSVSGLSYRSATTGKSGSASSSLRRTRSNMASRDGLGVMDGSKNLAETDDEESRRSLTGDNYAIGNGGYDMDLWEILQKAVRVTPTVIHNSPK